MSEESASPHTPAQPTASAANTVMLVVCLVIVCSYVAFFALCTFTSLGDVVRGYIYETTGAATGATPAAE